MPPGIPAMTSAVASSSRDGPSWPAPTPAPPAPPPAFSEPGPSRRRRHRDSAALLEPSRRQIADQDQIGACGVHQCILPPLSAAHPLPASSFRHIPPSFYDMTADMLHRRDRRGKLSNLLRQRSPVMFPHVRHRHPAKYVGDLCLCVSSRSYILPDSHLNRLSLSRREQPAPDPHTDQPGQHIPIPRRL